MRKIFGVLVTAVVLSVFLVSCESYELPDKVIEESAESEIAAAAVLQEAEPVPETVAIDTEIIEEESSMEPDTAALAETEDTILVEEPESEPKPEPILEPEPEPVPEPTSTEAPETDTIDTEIIEEESSIEPDTAALAEIEDTTLVEEPEPKPEPILEP
ncbi:MAG: hypothetical protein KAQ69_02390, partial [Spirochaetales bacterium]|nr:hypothetical protein [Spirochaetales bacterium]